MNYAKIMENGTVRISSIKKEGYKPLKEEKPEGFSNLVFVGYSETEENVIKEYEAIMFRWLKQRFCKHKYRKHYDKTAKGYVRRCVKCGKIE